MIERALLSTFDKTGIVELAQGLSELGVEIVASGGTADHLAEQGIDVTRVEDLTEIPELLGGPDTLMIGKVLWNEFFSNRDWPVASAVAIAMLVALVVPIMILRSAQAKAEES